jgi:trimeric autotransporter adhesin
MATTTNFGWETPDDTDLVKDGAAAMRTLGNSIDTSFVDLKGGTTGQILSKASNTDLDYTWIANDQGDITGITATSPLTGGGTSGAITVGIQAGSTTQSGALQLTDSTSSTSTTTAATPNSVKTSFDLANAAIPKSTVTTAGDVIYATGSGAVTRLGIGSAGQVLTVAAGVPSWATSSGSTASYSQIGTATLTGAATITISGLSGYNNLFVTVLNATCGTASSFMTFKFNSASANHSAFGQKLLAQASYGMGVFSFINSSNTGSVEFGRTGTNTGSRVNGTIQIAGANTTAVKPFLFQGGGETSGTDPQIVNGGGFFNAAAVISTISLISSAGNFSGGTMTVYGSVA